MSATAACGKLGERTPRLSVAGLMIAITLVGISMFLITRPIHGGPDLEPNLIPPRASPAELLVRVVGFTGLPLLAVAWHRWTGRRGIIAGLIAGAICYGGFILCMEPHLPHYDLDRFPLISNVFYFSTLGAAHGLILGLTAWTLAGPKSISRARRVSRARI